MASLFAHVALPVLARQEFPIPTELKRRLLWAAVACGAIADVDMLSYIFEVRPPAPLAHGGITHSFAFAAIFALVLSAALFRSLRIASRAWWKLVAFLFACGASHPLLDATTNGDFGVAFFWPLTAQRFSFPFKLLPACPLGLKEYFGFWGILTFANELIYVVAPLALVVALMRARRRKSEDDGPSVPRVVRAGGVLVLTILAVRFGLPEFFRPVTPRVIVATGSEEAGDPARIPRDGLPDEKLIVRLDELRAHDLIGRDLVPKHLAWSSSFFPSWLGGEGGRCCGGQVALGWRNVTGFAPPTENDARKWVQSANNGDAAAQQRLYTLAPTEKLDLAFDHYDFPETREVLARTSNGSFRYWNGRCNGVASAALAQSEPFRAVDVIGVNGARIRFHPNDIKSLLAASYNETQGELVVGGVCDRGGFDVGATCSMSAAVLVLAATNRIGLTGSSFLVDALPTIAKQYYAVAGARVNVVREPYPVGSTPIEPALRSRVASLVDVDIILTLSSTVLSYDIANRIDSRFPDGLHYEHVGVQPVVASYHATLALDASSEIIGSRWTGDPADGPDDIVFVGSEPALVDGKLKPPDSRLSWPLVRELARVSAEDGDGIPTVDLRTRCDGRCP